MIERIYIIEEADINIFFGKNKENIITIANQFPKLKIMSHENILKILGENSDSEKLIGALTELERICVKYNHLDEKDILRVIKKESSIQNKKNENKVIVFGVSGKPITARGNNQQKLVESFAKNDLTFAIGPAGSGKTFVAIALAVKALKSKAVRHIILSRPAVEAGEKLGFLPGEMKDKLDPYLQPLYDALGEMIPAFKLKEYLETGVIQIAPLAFMRGRTLSNSIIILDEAQNTTKQQMKMFLTRLGEGSKMIVTGDITQIDLPRGVTSGLNHSLEILSGIKGLGIIKFEKSDIIRHHIVSLIVDKYDKYEQKTDNNNGN